MWGVLGGGQGSTDSTSIRHSIAKCNRGGPWKIFDQIKMIRQTRLTWNDCSMRCCWRSPRNRNVESYILKQNESIPSTTIVHAANVGCIFNGYLFNVRREAMGYVEEFVGREYRRGEIEGDTNLMQQLCQDIHSQPPASNSIPVFDFAVSAN